MGKRLFIFITVLLIAGIFTGWYLFFKESKYFGTSPLKAVPVEAPVFIRIRNLGDFATKTVQSAGWQSIRNIKGLSRIYRDFVFIDSLILKSKQNENFLRHKELIVVPGDSSKLYLLEIGSISEKNSINLFIRNYFQSKNITSTVRAYKSAQIQDYEWIDNGESKRLLFTFYRGMLMVCTESVHLIQAIDQMDQPSVLEDANYLRVNKNATKNIDLNIFINHKTFPRYLSGLNPDSITSGIFRPNYANWTEIDVIQKENQLLINGYTIPDTTLACYLTIFTRQKPVSSLLDRWMPSNTTYFAAQNVSQPSYFFDDFNSYLQKRNFSVQYNNQLDSLSKTLKIDIRHYLNEGWSGEVAVVFTNQNLEDSTDNRFLLVKVKSENNDLLVSAFKKWNVDRNRNFSDDEATDAFRNNILKMPDENFGNLFGELYFGSIPTKWMTCGDGFILMGSTPGAIKRYKSLLQRNELLSKTSSYSTFLAGLAHTSNFYLWCSPGQSLPFFQQVINPTSYSGSKNEVASLKRIDNFAWQWGYENGLVYNTAFLTINPDADQAQIPFWRYPLKAKMRNKPTFVSYSLKSNRKDLVFQDVDNQLIDLDKDGIERWKIRLEGPILGEIKMIDFSKNGEYQLLFNTTAAIHLIDKNGAEIRNYPVRLKSAATNEMAVFDYDGKKEYRFLIACRDRKVYNLDKYGKPILGWKFKSTEKSVEGPVKYFRIKTKDYLVFSDRSQTYILDRQGKEIKLARTFYDQYGKLNFSNTSQVLPGHAPTQFALGNEQLTELISPAENRTVMIRKDGSVLNLNLPAKYALQAIGTFNDTTHVSAVLGYSADGYLSNFQLILK